MQGTIDYQQVFYKNGQIYYGTLVFHSKNQKIGTLLSRYSSLNFRYNIVVKIMI
jgi:hypothetical protein